MSALHRPRSLAEAIGLMADPHRVAIAGGTDIFPAHAGRPPPPALVDLTSIGALRGIAFNQDTIQIGAATPWSDIAGIQLPPALAMLQQAAREIGSVQIQNRGTIGGNLCNASPAADSVPPLIALDARVELISRAGMRTMPLSEFILGNRRTALRGGELLSAILIPRARERAGSAFVKLGARRYMVISIVMAAALLEIGGDGTIRAARIAVGSASVVAQRLRKLEARLTGFSANGDFAALISPDDLAGLSPIDDVRASAAYRLDAAKELIRRALAAAARPHRA